MVLCVPGEHSTMDSIPSPHHPVELNTEGVKKAGGLTRQSYLQAWLCFCRFDDLFFLEPASLSSFTHILGSVLSYTELVKVQATLSVCLSAWLNVPPYGLSEHNHLRFTNPSSHLTQESV